MSELRAATEALDGNRPADARRHAENVLRSVEDERALLVFGVACLRLADPKRSLEALTRAAALNPGRAETHGQMGEAHAALGAYTEAQRAFRRALELDPRNAPHLERRAAMCGREEFFRAAGRNERGIHRDIKSLVHEVDLAEQGGDLAQAFGTVMLFALQLGQQQVTAAPFFSGADVVLGSRELDACVDALGARVLARRDSTRRKARAKRTVYIATQLYPLGGHTRVLRSYMDSDQTRDHVVLVTDLAQNPQLQKLVEPMFEGRKLLWAPMGDSLRKLHWLIDQLEELSPERVVLFQHQHDALAVAACQPELAPDLYFMHHSDYTFSLGVHHPRATHIDGTPTHLRDCRHRVGIADNIHVGYVTEDRPLNPAPLRRGARRLVTCTSATYAKLTRQGYRYTYAELVPWLLGREVERHVHVGLLPDPVLGDIYARLDQAGIARARFDYRGNVLSYWNTLREAEVDVAIGSFPLGGGLTLLEALGSGTPYIVHESYLQRTYCELDMTYPEGFTWRNYDELAHALTQLAGGACSEHAAAARRWYEQNYRSESLAKALSGERICGAEERAGRPYARDLLQSVLDTFYLH